MVKKLNPEEHHKTKEIYMDVFSEDTHEFIEYYYKEIAKDNTIYTIDDIAMLHLNPYKMSVYGGETDVNYIVAVATRAQYRKQGLMKKLMIKALEDMFHDGQPFVYLMPAAEAIYEPYDFVVIGQQTYYRPVIEGASSNEPLTRESRSAKVEDSLAIAEFSNRILCKDSDIYTKRTSEYVERILKEQGVQNGGVTMYLDGDDILAVASYSKEDSVKYRDILLQDNISLPLEYDSSQNMMARVINVEAFLKLIPIEILTNKGLDRFNLEDKYLTMQSGNYELTQDGQVLFSKEIKDGPIYTVEELTRLIFENTSVVFNEIV